MLLNLHKKNWQSGLKLVDYNCKEVENLDNTEKMVGIAKLYNQRVQEEKDLSEEQLKTRYVGKQDPKKHLGDTAEKLIDENVSSLLKGCVDVVAIQ